MPDHLTAIGSPALDTELRVRGIVSDILSETARPVSFRNDDILAELGVTSIGMVSLMLGVEREFDIEMPNHEITPEVFKSVATIAAMVLRLGPAAPAAGLGCGDAR